MNCLHRSPRLVYGVDFSGSADAGKKIWIARGIIEGKTLYVESCNRAEELLRAERKREPCLSALRNFIAERKDCAFGLDFPFGLPQELINEGSWEDFVRCFPKNYQSIREFRAKCREAGQSYELKRVTDRERRAPFSPYNLRIYRQTYYGLRDVLHPLVHDALACVLPMQSALPGKPWILEICPASTLKRLLKLKKLYSYKGRTGKHKELRSLILDALEKTNIISLSDATYSSAIDDNDGDALDSVTAAFAAFQALRNPTSLSHGTYRAYMIEGYIFC